MLLFYTLLLSSLSASNTLVLPEACQTVKMTGIECCEQITANCSMGFTHCNIVDTSGGTAVTKLILEECGYTGALPDFSLMYSLIELDLSGNFFSSLANISSFEGLTSLMRLDLSDMNSTLHGQEPPFTGNFPYLINTLEMKGNGFVGTLPSRLFEGDIIALDLSDNQLTGPLPQELSTATSLTHLNLNNNPLGGTLVNLGYLNHLQELYLENCGLTGNINVGALYKLVRARILNLNNNELDGVPPSLGLTGYSMTLLEEIHLSGNKLSGSIPSTSLENLPMLNTLDLSDNLLTGSVPSSIGDGDYFTELKTLILSGNKLEGTIPSNLGGDSSFLMYLDLSNNLLQGSVPKTLYSIPNLYYLDISNNSVTGGLPELDISYEFPKIQHLAVNNNSIGGAFPTTFGQLTETLTYFDLGFNHFSGEVPQSFSSFMDVPNATLNLGGNLALSCPVTNYSDYATNTDWGSYGTSGTVNCGHTYASPSPTLSPNHSGSGGQMDAGFIILIILGVFSVITGIIYWRWNAGKINNAVHEKLVDDDPLMDAVSYEDYREAPATDYKTAGTIGHESILSQATRRNEFS